jgi:hypothetical protein
MLIVDMECMLDRGITSETAVDGKGRQYEHQGVDDGPDKRYPGRHFEVSRLIYTS